MYCLFIYLHGYFLMTLINMRLSLKIHSDSTGRLNCNHLINHTNFKIRIDMTFFYHFCQCLCIEDTPRLINVIEIHNTFFIRNNDKVFTRRISLLAVYKRNSVVLSDFRVTFAKNKF